MLHNGVHSHWNVRLIFKKVARAKSYAFSLLHCHGLSAGPHTFYPLHWKQWEELFVSGGSRSWTWPHDTVGIHLWNKFSRGSPLHPGDGSVVDRTSRRNCPKTYDTVKQIRKLRDNLQRQKMRKLSLRRGQGL